MTTVTLFIILIVKKVTRAGTRDEPLRTSAWEATLHYNELTSKSIS